MTDMQALVKSEISPGGLIYSSVVSVGRAVDC